MQVRGSQERDAGGKSNTRRKKSRSLPSKNDSRRLMNTSDSDSSVGRFDRPDAGGGSVRERVSGEYGVIEDHRLGFAAQSERAAACRVMVNEPGQYHRQPISTVELVVQDVTGR